MGAKTKLVFPVVHLTETDTRSCECSKDAIYFPNRNLGRCKDNFCQSCLQSIANPRTNPNQRFSNIPILCHIQSSNSKSKGGDFQKLLRAQRKSSFLEFLPSKFTSIKYNDDLMCSFPVISTVVAVGNLKQSVGSIPSYEQSNTDQSNRVLSHSRISIGNRPAIKIPPEEQTIEGKISVDETIKCRIKDGEGYIRRAACVCVNEDETKVLLVSSKNDGGGWLIPGGGLEDGEEEIVAARREAWEEAGIKGRITRWLGIFQCKDDTTKKKKRTSVFVLRVSEELIDFPEANLGRVRGWFDFNEAKKLLSICKPNQMAYLDSLMN